MNKKDILLYVLIFVLFFLSIWQWISKGAIIGQLNVQLNELQNDNKDMRSLTGLGQLGSAHLHADVKFYIHGKAIDFSQKKYQLATRYIHFEDGIGEVVHIHATGLTMGQLLKSLGIDFGNSCIIVEGADYCGEGNKKLKFYANGKPNSEFDNYIIKDLDKIMVSYGTESDAEIQKQLNSVTNLAAEYSANKYS